MPWLHWWVPEFLISSILWLWLAPEVGALLFSKKNDSDLNYVLGFSVVYFVASFLVVLHQWGLPLLFILLVGLKVWSFLKKQPQYFFKGHWTDYIIFSFITVVSALLPVTLDSNLQKYQQSVLHDFWPLDWAYRLDTHFGFPALFSFWADQTPIANHLSVQAPFFALLTWKIIFRAYEALKKSKPEIKESLLLLFVFLGTNFFRRQTFLKASPISGLFLLLFCTLLCGKEKTYSSKVLGWILACTFIFGEYGFLVAIPLICILFLSKNNARNVIADAIPWAIVFAIPELFRKLWLVFKGTYTSVLVGIVLVVLGWSISKYLIPILMRIFKGIKNFEFGFFIITLIFGLLLSFVFSPISGYGESGSYSFYQWSIQREGLLFLISLIFIYRVRKDAAANIFTALLSTQFFIYILWRLVASSGKMDQFNPAQIWWNLEKNAMMILNPLLITVIGTTGIFYFLNSSQKLKRSHKTKTAVTFIILLFYIFLQDPLVKRVGDGPLAPHSPRFAALQSFQEIKWLALNSNTEKFSSKSGNIVLWPKLALAEPEVVEKIFELQKKHLSSFKICLNKAVLPTGVGDFDVFAYTIEYPTGASVTSQSCNLSIVSKAGYKSCSKDSRLIFESPTSFLCQTTF